MRNLHTPLKNQFGKIGLLLTCLVGSLPGSSYSQTVSYTFSSAGATGINGPTQTQVNTTYSNTNLQGSVAVTNGFQTFTVPTAGPYRIVAIGAQGGYNGGNGAYISGDYIFAAGTVLKILVGQTGTQATNSSSNTAGGGGGGSFVTDPSNVPYVVAGGGGGRGDGYNGAAVTSTFSSMQAAITTTGNTDVSTNCPGGTNGAGGTANATANGYPGGAGAGIYGNGAIGSAASSAFSYTNGGTGGTGLGGMTGDGGFGGGGGCYNSSVGNRGGGGGGYSGGGAGWASSPVTLLAPGGGGGSYSNGINQTASVTAQTGDGTVIVTQLCDVNLTASGSSSLQPHICMGNSLTLSTNAISGYSWSTGATSSSIVVSPTITTTYTVLGNSALSCSNVAAITITVNSAVPTLTLTANTATICMGNSITLTGDGALTYTWSTGATSTASTSTIIDTPASTTTYTLRGSNGCGTSSTTLNMPVVPLPVTASANTTLVCAGSPAVLSGGGATTYTWIPGNAVSPTFTATPSAATVYTVTGSTGNCATSTTISVSTNALPSITITPSSSVVCQGEQVTLNAAGNALSYTWNPTNSNGMSITDSPTQSSVYSISGTSSQGCVGSTSQLIIAKNNPTVTVSIPHPIICSGSSVTLTAHGAASYAWDGGSSTGSVNVVTPAATTDYTVVGTNTAGCTGSMIATINVLTPSVGITSDVSSVCPGSHANLTASGADAYHWSNQVNAPSINVSPTVSTVYTVTGTSNDPNSGLSCTSNNSIMISVYATPTITATADQSVICNGKSALLTADGAGATGTYTWTGGAGIVMTATDAVSPLADQTYTVTGADANGCKGKATVLITISPCTGIAAIAGANSSLQVYPNPSNGEFTITSDQNITLQISNELGQHVRTVSINGSNTSVKVNELSNGIYFITGQNENGSVKQKVVITK